MKKNLILSIVAILCFATNLSAQDKMQDVLYLQNGSIIKGIIIEQIPNVSVKIKSNEGNIYVYDFKDILKFSKEEVMVQSTKDTVDYCSMAYFDADEHYKGKGSLRGWIYPVTILTSPIIGLIPAAIGSGNDLSNEQLNYPNRELMKNTEYRDCYIEKANKKKKSKAWAAYGISSGIWLVLILLL